MQQTYKRPFIFSIILHVLIIVVLITQLNFTGHRPVSSAKANTQPIKAVAINSGEVAAQVAKLKAERQAKEQSELKRQQRLAEQAATAKRQRELEQQRVAQLKAEATKLRLQQAAQAKAEAQKLAKIKAQQVAEQKRLSELAKQQQEAKKALQQKQLAEQQSKAAEEDSLLQQQLDQAKLQAQQATLAKYGDMIRNAIQQQWIVPENMTKDIACRLLIQVGPGGVVLDVKLVQSSGNSVLDRSAMAAVRKASPLPVPSDESLFNEFREINLLVRPEGITGG